MTHEYLVKVTRKGRNPVRWYSWVWMPGIPTRPDLCHPYWSQVGLGLPSKAEALDRARRIAADFRKEQR